MQACPLKLHLTPYNGLYDNELNVPKDMFAGTWMPLQGCVTWVLLSKTLRIFRRIGRQYTADVSGQPLFYAHLGCYA